MPARPRSNTGQFVFHVFNRAVQSLVLFEHSGDYDAFLRVADEATRHRAMRILAYCVMPNHWHLVLWPQDDFGLSAFMHWLTVTHAKRWREAHGNPGRGAVYQGRYKAVAIQQDQHLLRACCYVERNAARARLVGRAEDWPWTSASRGPATGGRPALATWPVPKPTGWVELLNLPEPTRALHDIRRAIRTGLPYGNLAWRAGAMRRLDWLYGGRRGRQAGRGTIGPRTFP